MAFKAAELVAFCESMVGQKYWYGTYVNPCTESKLKSKTAQYPSHYTAGRMATYRKHIADGLICMDCVGMIKGFFWTNGGVGVLDYIKTGKAYKNAYASNNCPDTSANGMIKLCEETWSIANMPDEAGLVVWRKGHIGVYVGNGEVVEARGYKYGVVRTKLKDRGWTKAGRLPEVMLDYDGKAENKPAAPKAYKLGDRILKNTEPNMTGDDVKEMQTHLNALGHSCGTADGEFGNKTETGVRAFQKAAGLVVDGKFGPKSLAALKGAETLTNTDYEVYPVREHDTLWDIAKAKLGKGSRYTEIIELNNLKSTTIHTGDKLKIPKK